MNLSKRKIGSYIGMTIFLLFVLFIVHFFYSFSQESLEQVFYGEKARGRINDFFSTSKPITIEQSAKDLYYLEDGFMDATYYIGLSLTPDKAWKLIRNYCGKSKKDFKKYDSVSYSSYNENESKWNIKNLKKPLYHSQESFSKKNKQIEWSRLIIYDEVTQRLLISFISY
jgi:hypothetical protein